MKLPTGFQLIGQVVRYLIYFKLVLLPVGLAEGLNCEKLITFLYNYVDKSIAPFEHSKW